MANDEKTQSPSETAGFHVKNVFRLKKELAVSFFALDLISAQKNTHHIRCVFFCGGIE